ncbi:helix-turn-helix transcriptional regulator [Gordonia aurantiaca]|uniref:helix-turn-helix transcriptional regulator n=1 Tax=Gordonia sp. B21 TaxID=3151852 RepID=UPI003263C2BE
MTHPKALKTHRAQSIPSGSSPETPPTQGTYPSVVVTIEAARPSAIAPVIAVAHGISMREREVVDHLVTGMGTSAIADSLGISSHTVRDHVKSILHKFGASTRAELMALLLGTHRAR